MSDSVKRISKTALLALKNILHFDQKPANLLGFSVNVWKQAAFAKTTKWKFEELIPGAYLGHSQTSIMEILQK